MALFAAPPSSVSACLPPITQAIQMATLTPDEVDRVVATNATYTVRQANAIFRGQVVQSVTTWPNPAQPYFGSTQRATFSVDTVWKGVVHQEAVVTSDDPYGPGSYCAGIQFGKGEQYLVFASVNRDGTFRNDLASGTRLASRSTYVLQALGPGAAPAPTSTATALAQPSAFSQASSPVQSLVVAGAIALILMGLMSLAFLVRRL